MMCRNSGRRSNAAFTLIELLLVLAIIILLASLTTGAVMKFMATGPRTATRSNLRTLKAKLDDQWKAVRDKASTETIPVNVLTNLQNAVGAGTLANDPRVRAKYLDLKLTQAFPQNFSEALNPGMGLPAWSGYADYLNRLGINGSNLNSVPVSIQNAVCLMMALERGPGNLGVTPDALGLTAAILFPVGPRKQQAFGCVDAWGNPLLFTRNSSMSPPAPVISTQAPSEILSTSDLGSL